MNPYYTSPIFYLQLSPNPYYSILTFGSSVSKNSINILTLLPILYYALLHFFRFKGCFYHA